MLLSSAAMFGSERVLYKFVATTTSSTSIAGKASAGESEYSAVDVSAYCFEIGNSASAEYYNYGSTGEMFKRDSVRLANKDSYLHISLARPLSVGDVIAVKSKQTDKVYFSHTSTRARVALVNDDLTFTIPSGSKLVGTTDLYMWKDEKNIYIHELVITTTSEEVAYYDFEDETITDFSSAQTYTLDNGLKLNSNGGDKHNKISDVSEKGFSKMLNIVGNGTNRSLMLEVTDPCTIEVWGRATGSTARSIYISEGSYSQSEGSSTKVLNSVANVLTKGTYTYSGLNDPKTLYLSADGGVYIAAIRVVYKELPVIAGNAGSLNSNKNIWTSTTGYITIAEETASNNAIASTTNSMMDFSDKSSNNVLRLASGKTYKVSVPTNKLIVSAYIEACAASGNTEDAKLKVNGGSWTELSYSDNTTTPTIFTPAINASSFTIETNSKNAHVQIKLLLSDLDYYPVTITNGWASFCAPQDVELPSGVYAYVADIVRDEEGDEDVLYINKVENSAIPANTGVFLYSETDGDYQLPYTLGAPAIAKNLFTGTVARTANPSTDTETGTTYSLYDDNGTVCLVRYTGAYIPANKAYLNYGGGGRVAAPRMRVHVGPYNTPTAIDEVQTSTAQTNKRIENGQLIIIRDGVKYNVQGQIVK